MSAQRWGVRQGDALDAMAGLADASVDAVIADPPYCSGGATEASKRVAPCQGVMSQRIRSGEVEWFKGDNMTTPGLLFLLRSIAFEAARVLVPGGSLIVFTDWRMWSMLAPALESGGLRMQSMLVWDKEYGALGTGFRPTHELAAHLCNGPGKFYDKCGSNVLRCGRIHHSKKLHPTEKPVEILRQMVRVTTPVDGLVLDPFCGSGSTGEAALLEGRRFLGIERDAEYVDTARIRLTTAEAIALGVVT